jgi:hypothetical protein
MKASTRPGAIHTVVGAVSWQDLDGRSLQRPWRAWSAPAFVVDSNEPVPAGVDGEALRLDPPLNFSIRHRVLRVRIARKHPGASPSAMAPATLKDSVVGLLHIAFKRKPPDHLTGA